MIRLLVPKVPTADDLLPYLRRIDAARWYSNFGQLVRELESRLAAIYPGAEVVTVSSCTAGLELALLLEREKGMTTFGCPALTFPATALAAHYVGMEVVLDDVDPDTWTDGYVSAFGVPGYGPGVIDAAGAFGEQTVRPGETAVFSLHATKIVSGGEGGYIVTHDRAAADELRRMTNFGFAKGVSLGAGTNAKMSEYHAAVALASLDAYDRAPWLQLYDWYEEHLPKGVVKQRRPRGVYPIMAVKLPVPAGEAVRAMARSGIETRRWYNPPLYQHPLFERDPLPVTADLAKHLLGLPYHLFLTEHDVREVCAALGRLL